ncbi:hypothetical protein M431DRAFT_86254, partial [Trichoderma harzianum CBS 226.95]
RTSGSVDDAPKLSPAFTFITRRGLTPEHSHTKTTPFPNHHNERLASTSTPLILLRPQTRTRKMPKSFDELDNGTEHGSEKGTEPGPTEEPEDNPENKSSIHTTYIAKTVQANDAPL